MEIRKYRELNQHETYPVTKKQLKQTLTDFSEATAIFGLSRKFEFDSRLPDPPRIKGIVVADASCNREKENVLYLYPIPKADYSEKANADFANSVLPKVKSWMEQQQTKPDTAVLGVEQLIIKWNGHQHRYHHSRFL